MRVLKAVEAVNNDQKLVLLHKIMKYFNGDVQGKTVALWGLSFKPQTDDMREAPSLYIVKHLLKTGAIVKAYDPIAINEAKHHFGETISYCEDQYETLIDADCLAILTECPEFKFPNLKIVQKLLNTPAIFDGRNIYDRVEMKESGFDYFCIGIDTSRDSAILNS